MAIWQFVADMASANPAVNLDLNVAPIMVGDGYSLDPPKFNKGYAGSPLRHGATPTNSVAENRVLSIPLQLLSTGSSVAAVIEDIGQQVMVDNILKVQFGSANPVFFRTFADPDYAIEVKKTLVEKSRVTLTLEAEPFAYGVRETAGTFTVSNNPANVTNPCRFDVSGISGDAPTPLLIVATSTGASGAPSGLVNKWVHVGARRRGSSSNYSPLIQAESMTQGTDAVATVDAAFSGGSKSRISFATPTNALRLSDTFPGDGVAVSDARGEYIVYARCAKTVAADVITVQLGYGSSSGTAIFNDTKTLPLVAGPFWTELGKVPVPSAGEPKWAGFAGGAPLKVLLGLVGLWAARTSGTGQLDVDCLYFMPADDQTLMVKFPSTDTTYAIDGTTPEGGAVYSVNAALDTVNTIASPPQVVGGGGFPEALPLQQNRFHFLRHVNPDGSTDALTDTTTFTVYYWPRWREFTRP